MHSGDRNNPVTHGDTLTVCLFMAFTINEVDLQNPWISFKTVDEVTGIQVLCMKCPKFISES